MAGTSQLAVLPPTSIHLETQHKALNKWGENGSFFLTLEHDNVSWIFSGKKQSKRGVLSKDRWMERERFGSTAYKHSAEKHSAEKHTAQ